MTHPTEDLAAYVDGTLTDQERTAVDTHLATCAQCSHEVELARSARAALGALPQVKAPDGLAKRAAKQAHADGPEVSGARRWLGIAAAAAVVVLLVGFGLTQLSSNGRSASTTAQEGTAANAGALPPAVADRNNHELQALADREAERYAKEHGLQQELAASDETGDTKSAGDATSGQVEIPPHSDQFAAATTTPAASPAPVPATTPGVPDLRVVGSDGKIQKCLHKSGAFANGGTLLRSYEGELAGIPAYYGVFAEGEQPGGSVDRVVVWVARKDGCGVIAFSQAFIIRPSPSPLPSELAGLQP